MLVSLNPYSIPKYKDNITPCNIYLVVAYRWARLIE